MPAAVARILPLAWELPHAKGAALNRPKKSSITASVCSQKLCKTYVYKTYTELPEMKSTLPGINSRYSVRGEKIGEPKVIGIETMQDKTLREKRPY